VDELYARPQHPYTRGLLASLPVLGGAAGARRDLAVIPGLPPDPVSLPPGCAFYPRCSVRGDPRCAVEVPPLRPAATGATDAVRHRVATFYDLDPVAPAPPATEDGPA
ncbi:MAG: hypothetical protein JXA83_00185, partial [Acidimicrobiales bacterium]|nr:hypothetical protein [Acidimicrobiales bacterium]